MLKRVKWLARFLDCCMCSINVSTCHYQKQTWPWHFNSTLLLAWPLLAVVIVCGKNETLKRTFQYYHVLSIYDLRSFGCSEPRFPYFFNRNDNKWLTGLCKSRRGQVFKIPFSTAIRDVLGFINRLKNQWPALLWPRLEGQSHLGSSETQGIRTLCRS